MRGRLLPWGLVVVGALLVTEGLWIPAKAWLAQELLEDAFRRARAGEAEPRPWSWADTHPVALLEAPRLEEKLIVLAGASGRNLAFGPGHVAGTAGVSEAGNVVVAGHRDTHFAFLKEVSAGDELFLEDPLGRRRRYVVREARVVHERDTSVLAAGNRSRLTLVTCYPFDAVTPGGPLRYVVVADETHTSLQALRGPGP